MIETGNALQLSDYLLLLSHVATVVGCTEVLFQPSFSLCRSTLLPVEDEVYNALVVVWSGRRSMLRITEPDTTRTETERAPTSPDETHHHESRLYRSQRTNAHHPRMDRPISARTVHVVLEPTLRGARLLYVDPRQHDVCE